MTNLKVEQTSPAEATQTRVPALWLLVGLSSVGPLALNIFQPSIGAIAADFSVSTADVQWALTVYIAGLAFGQIIYGPLSDRYGRRPLIFAGLILFILSNIWLALAPSFFSVLLGRALQALAGCSGMVLTRAIVRDCYSSEKSASAYGYITTAMVAVPALAPALGYALETLGSWRYSFWFLVAFGSLVAFVTWRYVPETNKAPISRLNLETYVLGSGDLIANKSFLAYCGVIGFGTGSFFCFLTGAPYATVEVLGGTGKDFSLYFLILSAGYMAGNFVSGRYATAMGLPRMMRFGHIISLIGAAIFIANLVAPSMLLIFAPGAVIAFGGGLYNPAGMAGALSVRPDIAGTASSVVGVISMVIAISMSAIANLTMGPSLLGFVVPYVGCSLCAAICTVFALKQRPLAQRS
jgi:DHA1 family bicyclomycin/chloramphenicol resistance-like MFS transporter